MANKSLNLIKNAILQTIIDNGYNLVDIEYKSIVKVMTLTITIDKIDGVDIGDCEKVHKAIDKILDDIDFTNGAPYTLNVSSYGLDRNLKNDYDFNKFLNKEVILKFYENYLDKKSFVAKLLDFDKDYLVVNYLNNEYKIERDKIAAVSQIIDF